MSRFRLLKFILASPSFPDPRRSSEWQHWRNANHGLRDSQGEEVITPALPLHRLLRQLTPFRYQSRAFLLFPMCFNIGVIIGPILGGLLADPAGSYPNVFGHVTFFIRYPYATPNILSAIFLFSATLGIFFGLSEVWSFFLLLSLVTEPVD